MAKILIIDDANFMRIALREMIKMIGGHETIEATNGREGIEMICSDNPDVVITDILMPEMDGVELLKTLRETNVDANIIVISANTDDTTRDICLDLGVSAFLNKPPKLDELAKTITEVLQKTKP